MLYLFKFLKQKGISLQFYFTALLNDVSTSVRMVLHIKYCKVFIFVVCHCGRETFVELFFIYNCDCVVIEGKWYFEQAF